MRKRRYYEVWNEYNEFVKSLHLETEKERERKNFWWDYSKKLVVIFLASFLTTFSFKFLMSPNGLYNSGINGIIQIVSRYVSNAKPNNWSFSFYYYSTVIAVNAIMVLMTEILLPGNFEINSTAFFYVISQYIWSTIFDYLGLKGYFFNRLTQKTWSGISESGQLALTLPFYIVIGIIGSFLHSFGYSFIYQVKSSPGGFDIITSTLSQSGENQKEKKKRNFITNLFSRWSPFLVIFTITLISFIFIEDNSDLVVNQLIKDVKNDKKEIDSFCKKANEYSKQDKLTNKDELIGFLEELNNFKSEDFQKEKEFQRLVNNLNSYLNLEKYNDGDLLPVMTYLRSGKKHGLLKHYEEKLRVINEKISSTGKGDEFKDLVKEKEDIDKKISSIKDNIYESSLNGYLEYTTNNEQVWGSVVYVLLSSYFMQEFFPKNKIFKVYFAVYDDEELEDLTNYLKKYMFYFFKTTSVKNGEEKACTIVCCLITKWNYQLISDKIGRFEKVAVCETDEKSQ